MLPSGSLRSATVLTSLALLGAGCRPQQRATDAPPAAEFLVTAGDSAFWVNTSGPRFRVRRAPLTLAQVQGRFYELYVADADRSYFDALLIGQRIYRRDLVSGDSVPVFEDRRVSDIARAYASAHPTERPLDEDEDGSDDPHTVATSDTELLDVVGPLLSYEHQLDIDIAGGEDAHIVRHGVIDLRDGSAASLEHVFGDTAARRIIADGRAAYRIVIDSVKRSRGMQARRAARAIDAFRFDPTSYSIDDIDGAMMVAFYVPGQGDAGGGLELALPHIRAPKPAWWPEVAATVPRVGADSLSEIWSGRDYDVIAQYDTSGDFATLVIRDSTRRTWHAGRLPVPARRVYRFDAPALDSTSRHALARAFDESTLYSGAGRTVRGPARGIAPIILARWTSSPVHPRRTTTRAAHHRLDRL